MKKEELGESPVVVTEEGSVGLVETIYYSLAEPLLLDNGKQLGQVTVA